MNKKLKKIIIATGGTGGHVLPAYNLAKNFKKKNIDVEIISDKRGINFLGQLKDIKIVQISSTTIFKKNLFKSIYSIVIIFFAVIKSFIYLLNNKPSLVFGMGGYSSFPVCVAAKMLKIPFILYENNLLIGKVNRYLIPYSEKIFVSYKELEGVPEKFKDKIFETGNIIREEIFILQNKKDYSQEPGKLKILILGGSQAAKVFAEKLPEVFKLCKDSKIELEIFQQCLPEQNDLLSSFYNNTKINYEIFNFTNDILKYFSKSNLAISRSGASMSAELINMRIPFISVPLPSSADNHQLKNSIYYNKKGFSYLIEEKDLNLKLFKLLKNISENTSLLRQIIDKQSQYSDKSVYENINKKIEKIINEKY